MTSKLKADCKLQTLKSAFNSIAWNESINRKIKGNSLENCNANCCQCSVYIAKTVYNIHISIAVLHKKRIKSFNNLF